MNTFEVTETAKEYQVLCYRSSVRLSSRNKNITDRQLRMDAIDLMGAYILYKDSDVAQRFSADYFQIYVEGLNLHYEAVLEGIRQSDILINGNSAICYSCDKEAYKISYASYNSNLDLASLLEAHYQKIKSEESAFLLYSFDGFSVNQYVAFEREYLTGCVQLPMEIRQLQEISERFELSIMSPDECNLASRYREAINNLTQKKPFQQFYFAELVTAAPLNEKKECYDKWTNSLNSDGCIYESILAFCAQKCSQPVPIDAEATLTSVIEAFPGAISPFGIRRPADNTSYNKAAQAYAKSDFVEAIRILKEAIDIEGVNPEMLNLLGASYRLLNQPEKAMPYLLLCFKMAPNTQYLAGNIYLCLSNLELSKLSETKDFLVSHAVDSWSWNELR